MILPSCFCLKIIRAHPRNPWSKNGKVKGEKSFKCFTGFVYNRIGQHPSSFNDNRIICVIYCYWYFVNTYYRHGVKRKHIPIYHLIFG